MDEESREVPQALKAASTLSPALIHSLESLHDLSVKPRPTPTVMIVAGKSRENHQFQALRKSLSERSEEEPAFLAQQWHHLPAESSEHLGNAHILPSRNLQAQVSSATGVCSKARKSLGASSIVSDIEIGSIQPNKTVRSRTNSVTCARLSDWQDCTDDVINDRAFHGSNSRDVLRPSASLADVSSSGKSQAWPEHSHPKQPKPRIVPNATPQVESLLEVLHSIDDSLDFTTVANTPTRSPLSDRSPDLKYTPKAAQMPSWGDEDSSLQPQPIAEPKHASSMHQMRDKKKKVSRPSTALAALQNIRSFAESAKLVSSTLLSRIQQGNAKQSGLVDDVQFDEIPMGVRSAPSLRRVSPRRDTMQAVPPIESILRERSDFDTHIGSTFEKHKTFPPSHQALWRSSADGHAHLKQETQRSQTSPAYRPPDPFASQLGIVSRQHLFSPPSQLVRDNTDLSAASYSASTCPSSPETPGAEDFQKNVRYFTDCSIHSQIAKPRDLTSFSRLEIDECFEKPKPRQRTISFQDAARPKHHPPSTAQALAEASAVSCRLGGRSPIETSRPRRSIPTSAPVPATPPPVTPRTKEGVFFQIHTLLDWDHEESRTSAAEESGWAQYAVSDRLDSRRKLSKTNSQRDTLPKRVLPLRQEDQERRSETLQGDHGQAHAPRQKNRDESAAQWQLDQSWSNVAPQRVGNQCSGPYHATRPRSNTTQQFGQDQLHALRQSSNSPSNPHRHHGRLRSNTVQQVTHVAPIVPCQSSTMQPGALRQGHPSTPLRPTVQAAACHAITEQRSMPAMPRTLSVAEPNALPLCASPSHLRSLRPFKVSARRVSRECAN